MFLKTYSYARLYIYRYVVEYMAIVLVNIARIGTHR